MSFQRLALIAAFLIAFCWLAPAAHAQICEMCAPESPDDGFGGWTDPTMDGTAPNPPTTTACHAFARNNQQCRECVESYDNNGIDRGYAVCAYVPRRSACYCENAGTNRCTGKGDCSYYQ